MNSSEVVKLLALRLGISQVAAKDLMRKKLEELRLVLSQDQTVQLPRLGTFRIRQTKPRQAYIPGKDCRCLIPTRRHTNFKTSPAFKALLRKRGQ